MGQEYYSKSYIYDPYSSDVLQFQVNPSSISDGRTARFKKTDIPGAHLPRIVPSGGGERPFSFDVQYVADDENHHTPQWVKRQVQWLMSLTYPRIVRPGINATALTPVFLVLGDLLELPVYVESVRPTFGPFKNSNLELLVASVSISVTELAEEGEFVDAFQAMMGSVMGKQWSFEVPGKNERAFFFTQTESQANFEFGTGQDVSMFSPMIPLPD